MTVYVERGHWLNTIVGVIDGAWNLSPEEQVAVIRIVIAALDAVSIPDRGQPSQIPAALALEVESGFYAVQLDATLGNRPVRALQPGDQNYPVDVWAQAMVSMITSAYTDLPGEERLYLMKVFTDLFTSLGATQRSPVFLPSDVIRAAKSQ